MKNKAQTVKQRDRSLRLTFSYEGSDVRLVSRQSVEMVPPPSDHLRTLEGQTGFWYELRDAEGRTLYRRITETPVKFAAEVRSDDPRRPLTWEKVSRPQGHFVLLMPDLDQARTLVLFSSPLEPEAAAKPAKEIARFDLQQGPESREIPR